MPADLHDPSDAHAVATLRRGAEAAAARDVRRIDATMRDLFAEDEHEDGPDERLRAMVRAGIVAAVAPIERDLRLGAARRLAEMQAIDAAKRLLDDPVPVIGRLRALAATARASLVAELLDRARLRALAAGLRPGSSADDRPGLLVRLAQHDDPDVAATATELLAMTGVIDGEPAAALRESLRAPVIWWCAAVLRDRLGDERRADHALVDAAEEALAVPVEVRPETLALRLATSFGARADELPALLVEALGDRRPELFVALLARASGLDPVAVRAILVDPAGDRLWLLLRAQDIERTVIARIGVALADADPRRDLERFADELDAAMATSAEDAAEFFAPDVLPVAYREALRAIGMQR